MSTSYWERVHATGLDVPADRALDDLTAELTRMLGDPDPGTRDGTALPVLATWIERGVYDDLLAGLGDGMTAGLTVGLGEDGTDTVFRRSSCALVLERCIARDNEHSLVPGDKVLDWGDRLATWLLREQDLRGWVVDKGWAHGMAHGADALGRLAESRHLGGPELEVLLDVVAERLLAPVETLFGAGEPDRIAAAVVRLLGRDLVAIEVVERWLARLAARAGTLSGADGRDPFLAGGNAQAFLRALYLQLALGPHPPPQRADLLLAVVEAVRSSNPQVLASGQDAATAR